MEEYYSKMYKHNETYATPIDNEEVTEKEEGNETVVDQGEVNEIAIVYGRVVNCIKLNVREEPSLDSKIICTIDVLSDVEIVEDESTDEWYKIYLSSGLSGYCMKKYIVEIED